MTGIHKLGVLLVVISKLLVCLSVCLSVLFVVFMLVAYWSVCLSVLFVVFMCVWVLMSF